MKSLLLKLISKFENAIFGVNRDLRENSLDGTLVALAFVIGSAALAAIAFDDYFFEKKSSGITQGNRLGVFRSIGQDVRRKSGSDLNYSSVRNSDFVFHHDSVFTGDSSAAEIEFPDESKLKILSNSLVVVQRPSEGGVVFEINKGRVKGKLGKTTKLVLPGAEKREVVAVDGDAEVEVVLEENEKPTLKVMSGRVIVKSDTATVAPRFVESNESLALSNEAANKDELKVERSPAGDDLPVNADASKEGPQQENDFIAEDDTAKEEPAPKVGPKKNESDQLVTAMIPTPAPSPSPLHDSGNSKFNSFEILSTEYFSKVSAKDTVNGGDATLGSNLTFGLIGRWTQNWTQKIHSFLSFGFIRSSYNEALGRPLQDSSQFLGSLRAGAGYTFWNRLEFGVALDYSQYIMLRGVNSTVLTIDKVLVPMIFGTASFDLFPGKPLDFLILGDLGINLPTSAQSSTLKMSPQGGLAFRTTYSFQKGPRLIGDLFIRNSILNISGLNQSQFDLGLRLGVGFSFGDSN